MRIDARVRALERRVRKLGPKIIAVFNGNPGESQATMNERQRKAIVLRKNVRGVPVWDEWHRDRTESGDEFVQRVLDDIPARCGGTTVLVKFSSSDDLDYRECDPTR